MMDVVTIFRSSFYTGKDDTIFDKNGNSVNAIKSSQRPFKDDRTAEEKKNYLEHLEQLQKEKQKDLDEIEYYHIFYELPEIAPKSFGGYRKMKNAQTKNFLKLKDQAIKHGISIS